MVDKCDCILCFRDEFEDGPFKEIIELFHYKINHMMAGLFGIFQQHDRLDLAELFLDWSKTDFDYDLDSLPKPNDCPAIKEACFIAMGIRYLYDSAMRGDKDKRLLVMATAGTAMLATQQAYQLGIREHGFQSYEETFSVKCGSLGGSLAKANREKLREKFSLKVKEIVRTRKMWNSWSETAKSITDTIWAEIESVKNENESWHGFRNEGLKAAKIGRQTVYDAVAETDPR